MRLKIQLIPQTAYGHNLRSILSPVKWRQLSRLVCNNSGCVCEICGTGVNSIADMEAHEVWEYNVILDAKGKKRYIQHLKKIVAVCKQCHRVIHIGRTSYGKHYNEAVDHFMQVNGCTYSQFKKAEEKAYRKFQKRSKHKWKLDINEQYLNEMLLNSEST